MGMEPRHAALVDRLRRSDEAPSGDLEEFLLRSGQPAFNRLCDVARAHPSLVDDQALDAAARAAHLAPATWIAILLTLAARDPDRRTRCAARAKEDLRRTPGPALSAAGYQLHEYHPLLDEDWIRLADTYFAHDPEGAFGILEAAAMYEPHLVPPAVLDAFEPRLAAAPRDWFVILFSLASHRQDEAPGFLARALRDFDAHPAAALDAAAFAAKDVPVLVTEDLVAAVQDRLHHAPGKAWDFLEGAARTRPELFGEARLDALDALARETPGTLFAILRRLMETQSPGPLLDRTTTLMRRHPAKGIDHLRYAFQGEDLLKLRADQVRVLGETIEANAYPAYEMLGRCLERRPELVGRPEIEAAIRGIPHATNYAFGFFNRVLRLRPEFTPEAVLAVFECLALEPHHRAFVRAEQIGSILAVSEAAHVSTALEQALRRPARVGSRRARALMAMLFRQTSRARRHVLLEALKHASAVVLWRKGAEGERYSPLWDFMGFLVEHAPDDAVSTAAAERFLEGAFQLHYLCRTGAEYEAFLRSLDLHAPPPTPLPADLGALASDPELSGLHDLVHELARRFGGTPRLAPLEEFAGRGEAARRELAALEGRPGVEKRRDALRARLSAWEDPAYRAALAGGEPPPSGPLREAFRRDVKALSSSLRDALRAEAVRLALAAVDTNRLDLYRRRLRDILGRDVPIESVEPEILPSFLWFAAVQDMPKNREGLKRLIEDRVEKRPHDWLWTEPEARNWAGSVRAAHPGIRLERWRAPFEREIQYRPKDAAAEKERRIRHDLAQARELLVRAGAKDLGSVDAGVLRARLDALRRPDPDRETDPDPALLEEAAMNLERARLAAETPESDYEGRVTLSVESDPFGILFMGEYGFASCLSLRGSNAWSAVSNAVDVDKTVVWAREAGGNVVGRRLICLQPEGIVVFRTYVNRNGLALDGAFERFLEEYAEHVGTRVLHGAGRHPGPLLSDRWYDDGSV